VERGMALTRFQLKGRPIKDEEALAKAAGYRNFTSFIFLTYHSPWEKETLESTSKLLDVSAFKIRTAMIKRGFPIRSRSTKHRVKPFKRRVYIYARVRARTPFIFPWCAIYHYYWGKLYTVKEVGDALGISSHTILKYMKKYKINRRKQGTRNTYRMKR